MLLARQVHHSCRRLVVLALRVNGGAAAIIHPYEVTEMSDLIQKHLTPNVKSL